MRAIALYDCQGEDISELSFACGDIIENVETSEEPGWFIGRCNNKQGLFPGNYVRFEEDPGFIARKPTPSLILREQDKVTQSINSTKTDSVYSNTFTGVIFNKPKLSPPPSRPVSASTTAVTSSVRRPAPPPPKKPVEFQSAVNRNSVSSLAAKFENSSLNSSKNDSISNETTNFSSTKHTFEELTKQSNSNPILPVRSIEPKPKEFVTLPKNQFQSSPILPSRIESNSDELRIEKNIQPKAPTRPPPLRPSASTSSSTLPNRPVSSNKNLTATVRPPILPNRPSPAIPTTNSISDISRERYAALFNQYDRFQRNILSNNIVKSIWSRSQLDAKQLGSVWNLCYHNGEGLTKSEFIIGMFLIDLLLSGKELPESADYLRK